MILTSGQVVWTPILGKDSLAIALNRTFAEACLLYTPDDVSYLAKRIWSTIDGAPGHMPSNFLDIYNGFLPRCIYLDGGKGLWLEIDVTTLNSSIRPPTYNGHNEELLLHDRYMLMSAFAAWANAAMILMDWK